MTFAVGHWRLSRSGELCELVSSMNVTTCSPTRQYLGMHVEVTRMSSGEEAILDSQLLSFPEDVQKD